MKKISQTKSEVKKNSHGDHKKNFATTSVPRKEETLVIIFGKDSRVIKL